MESRDGIVWRAPLSPLSFLLRSAGVWRDRTAVIDGDRRWTYAEHLDRVERAAGMLTDRLGVEPGARVATLLPNTSPLLELHYAVPGIGAILVPLNTRLAVPDYEYILDHAAADVVFADRQFASLLSPEVRSGRTIVWVGGEDEYEHHLAQSPRRPLAVPDDEDSLLSINYTSGTTGRPKGVMTTHRGAYLHTLGVIAEARLEPRSAYLWTLPMFHCNGWAYVWAVTAAGASHVCLPRVDPAEMWRLVDELTITHMCAAPTVVSSFVESPHAHPVQTAITVFIGGAPPAPVLIERAERLQLHITHLYGLTETYGPIAVCAWNPDWDDEPLETQTVLRSRQGVGTMVSQPLRVVNTRMEDVPQDGQTLGEVVMQGNNVMKGYYRDEPATADAFRGGWFHSGDLGVMHPDGYIELKDRLKDVIISGGENISTIEVEQAIMSHAQVVEAAVVAAPDDKWGEVPVAYLTVRGEAPTDAELREHLLSRIARFKIPRRFEIVATLPKTGTGKIQKFILRDQATRS